MSTKCSKIKSQYTRLQIKIPEGIIWIHPTYVTQLTQLPRAGPCGVRRQQDNAGKAQNGKI